MKNLKKLEEAVVEAKVEAPVGHRVTAVFDPVYLIDQSVWVSPGEVQELLTSNDLMQALAAGKLKYADAD